LLSATAGIQMVHVPFAGLGPATNALMAGTVDVGLVTPVQVKPYVESGALRALAVSSKKRSRVLPNVPTLEETGLLVSAVVAYGLTAPVRTPPSIVARLRIAMDELTKDKTFTDHFEELGFELDPLIGDAYRDFIVKDLEQWRGVARAAAIKIDN
jgi:tripartite-type tricarboxylate transporter receptor subunit TctC